MFCPFTYSEGKQKRAKSKFLYRKIGSMDFDNILGGYHKLSEVLLGPSEISISNPQIKILTKNQKNVFSKSAIFRGMRSKNQSDEK